MDDRSTANAVLGDIRATMAEIVRIEDGYAVGHENYVNAAERARNGLVGDADSQYVAAAGTVGDGTGAIAHVDALLDRKTDSVWTPAMQGVKINLLAASQSLSDALNVKQMEDYETALTQALSDLSLAVGRASDHGVLGGIQGALASTTLGVPPGAAMVPGCRAPSNTASSGPAYGVVDGNLTFVSLPRSSGELAVPGGLVVQRVAITAKRLVLYTQPQADVSKLCKLSGATANLAPSAAHVPFAGLPPLAARYASDARGLSSTASVVAQASPAAGGASAGGSAAGSGAGVGFTAAQAHAGSAVYKSVCISCHGANLQGVAGPAVAGKDFLASAATNKWTYADLRNLVVQQMPLNNPGSLTPTQYANVIAYLLAANCFPASATAFPEKDDPALAAAKFLTPAAPAAPTDKTLQVCAVP